uniref:Uncharacterized protein n=1 Tax=Craspedostauros australis TaxID=1486917 RepID=A0A7R9ZQT2_9STRA
MLSKHRRSCSSLFALTFFTMSKVPNDPLIRPAESAVPAELERSARLSAPSELYLQSDAPRHNDESKGIVQGPTQTRRKLSPRQFPRSWWTLWSIGLICRWVCVTLK